MPSSRGSKDSLSQLLSPDHVFHHDTEDDDEGVSPFEAPDLYYGPNTDPSNRNNEWGRIRTRSAVFRRPTDTVTFNSRFLDALDTTDSESESEEEGENAVKEGVDSGGSGTSVRDALFDLQSDESDDDDDDDESSEIVLKVPPSGKVSRLPRILSPRERLRNDAVRAERKKVANKVGVNDAGFMSDVDAASLEAASNPALEPSSSTGSLVVLQRQLRSNDSLADVPTNHSVDSLVDQSGAEAAEPESDLSDSELSDDDPLSGSLRSRSIDSLRRSLAGSSARLSSHSEEALVLDDTGTKHRSPSFVKRYNKGLTMWNELLKTGKLKEDGSSTSKKKNEEANTLTSRGYSPPVTTETTADNKPADKRLRRRGSADDASSRTNSKRFFISDIDATLEQLLANEDTDHNCQITIDDTGPKVLKLGTANSNGFKQYDIRGTYMLSNLLQELTIARRMGRKQMILDEARLNENPVDRLTRLIRSFFWKNLTRQVTRDSVLPMARDDKIHTPAAKIPRIYVPHEDAEQYAFYTSVAREHPEYNLDIERLPTVISDEWVKSVNDRPGFLALAMRHVSAQYGDLEGYPYVVPGGRFNEQYGWDSYFAALGLLKCGIVEPCEGMCRNFVYEIAHYGKILNANRSYYLCRSQPPFLTQMALSIFQHVRVHEHREELDLLRDAVTAAIKEYNEVWCCAPRLDPRTGLSTYHPTGLGIPPETEPSHFHAVLKPYCKKYGLTFEQFTQKYNDGEIKEPVLDEYFVNDRGVRESGHDTSYRLEGRCAHLATVELNSLLYKYETDIAFIIKTYFNDNFALDDGTVEKSDKWTALSEQRRANIDKYLWNEHDSLYYDYNVELQEPSTYESVTSFFPMWAGLCSSHQAELLVKNSVSKFEEFGGLVSGTERSRGNIGLERPSRQWDYPFAWAPHQIIVWKGLSNYGYFNVARRLSYRWCYMMTLAFVDFNGIVVEKYDATSENQPHKVDAEYGNQGSGFKGVATEGFAWVNSSFLVGLGYLDRTGIRALGMVTSPTDFFKHMRESERGAYALVSDAERWEAIKCDPSKDAQQI